MKFRLLTLFSIVLALVIKTYSMSARDGILDDEEVALLAQWELKNADDSTRHKQHVGILANELAASNQITEEFTGAGALVKCQTYHHYARLRAAANEFELNELLTHESPVIRVYAHRAMMERRLNPDPDIVAEMAADSTEIEWLKGDVLIHTTVMEMVSSNMFHLEEPDTLVAILNF